MPETFVDSPLLTPRFASAFELATEVHAAQVRKSTKIPYLAHIMAVTALVLEAGGDEDCAIGALLHDTVEDCDDGVAMGDRIRAEYGHHVFSIVSGCSDTVATPGQPKPAWRPRKEAHLRHLEAEQDLAVLLVSACDKLHNGRAIVAELVAGSGQSVWSRFTVGRQDQLWYYGSLAGLYRERSATVPGGQMLERVATEFSSVVAQMGQSAESSERTQ